MKSREFLVFHFLLLLGSIGRGGRMIKAIVMRLMVGCWVGWVVKSVDLTRQTVTFMKSEKLKLGQEELDLGKLRQEWIDRLKEKVERIENLVEERLVGV